MKERREIPFSTNISNSSLPLSLSSFSFHSARNNLLIIRAHRNIEASPLEKRKKKSEITPAVIHPTQEEIFFHRSIIISRSWLPRAGRGTRMENSWALLNGGPAT